MSENERGKMSKHNARETYSKRSCSVKPTLEQERDLQIIEKEEHTTRSKMMREALKDYLTHKRLRKVGRDLRKDPAQLLLENALEEQLDPLRRQIESITTTLQTLTQTLPTGTPRATSTGILSFTGKPEDDAHGASLDAVLVQLEIICKLLEQNFHDTLITQMIAVNFLVEQHVRTAQPDANGCLELVERVRKRKEGWSETTAQVVAIIRQQMNVVSLGVANDFKREAGVECVVLPPQQGEQLQISNGEKVAAT